MVKDVGKEQEWSRNGQDPSSHERTDKLVTAFKARKFRVF
jgi:hypothetical protein